MEPTKPSPEAYSADVRMHLRVREEILSIAHPDFIILADDLDYPPAEAEIALSIDGRIEQWPVYLPDGIVRGQRRTQITRAWERD